MRIYTGGGGRPLRRCRRDGPWTRGRGSPGWPFDPLGPASHPERTPCVPCSLCTPRTGTRVRLWVCARACVFAPRLLRTRVNVGGYTCIYTHTRTVFEHLLLAGTRARPRVQGGECVVVCVRARTCVCVLGQAVRHRAPSFWCPLSCCLLTHLPSPRRTPLRTTLCM